MLSLPGPEAQVDIALVFVEASNPPSPAALTSRPQHREWVDEILVEIINGGSEKTDFQNCNVPVK
jgi:hypothetical protein